MKKGLELKIFAVSAVFAVVELRFLNGERDAVVL
jgi:hypothetical protein